MRLQANPATLFILGLITAPLLASMSGCSLFSTRADAPAKPGLNSVNVSNDSNPVAVPVDVAQDIARIRSGWEPAEITDFSRAESGGFASAAPALRAPAAVKHGAGKSENYKVKTGDTLMKISFEKYGDVYRWREIYDRNKDKIANYNALVNGTTLVIDGVEYLVIERNGQPYMIRKADTLVKISRSLYGTPRNWSELWHNNPHLIHDPNKIYAGFTLYYRPEVRQPSSQTKLHK